MGPRGAFLGAGQQQFQAAPNAALLIDFDNVTMTIRSDLGKEIKALLKSDVIRGKVAVQRAYADWRRYPQYIVPLTESSVDLIFAPAYGSAKKNATDLRMAIDAIELVFTRPEIGTFILMTGDSDFSSCVLKLKEYGKYVIGVGMRESSSDLLIQNCDEYYSYHSISGLTRASEVQDSKEDPWVLVRRAVQQMIKNGDVMRTDRLKQVMLELDPGFDEKKVGYSKFSRFVSEAASKGIVNLRKTENGQYEIVGEKAPAESREQVVERIVAEAEAGGNGRRRRGRGREDRAREDRPRAALQPDEAEAAKEVADEPSAEVAETPVAAGRVEAVEERVPEASGDAVYASVEGLDGAYSLLQEAVRRLTGRDGKTARDGDVKRKMIEISRTFDESSLGFPKFTRFLRQAHDAEVIDLNRVGAGNYEVALPAGGKRLPAPALDEEQRPAAEQSRARPATDKVDARSAEDTGTVSAPAAGPPPTRAPVEPSAPTVAAPPAGALRGRRGGRALLSGPPPILPGQVIASPLAAAKPPVEAEVAGTEAIAAEAAGPEAEVAPKRSRRGRRGRGREEKQEKAGVAGAEEEEAVAETPAEQPVADDVTASDAADKEARSRTRGRRGRRGRGREAAAEPSASAAGATEAAGTEPASPAEPAPSVTAEAEPAPPPVARRTRSRRGRSAMSKGEDAPPPILEGQIGRIGPAEPASAEVASEPDAAPAKAPARSRRKKAATAGGADAAPAAPKGGKTGTRSPTGKGSTAKAAEAPTRSAFDAASLGLPRSPAEITEYLSASYKGVGKKTAETLLERFGPDLFEAMQERPSEIRGMLDERRAGALLEQWTADYARRTSAKTRGDEESRPTSAGKSAPTGAKGGGRARGGRKQAVKSKD
jgi:uncharacterized protein (TIGR00288 family)